MTREALGIVSRDFSRPSWENTHRRNDVDDDLMKPEILLNRIPLHKFNGIGMGTGIRAMRRHSNRKDKSGIRARKKDARRLRRTGL